MTRYRRTNALARAVLLLTVASALFPGLVNASQTPDGFGFFRRDLPPLRDTRVWVLQGTRLVGGGCRYLFTTQATEIPAEGWIIRSIALDPAGCRKLMEEGRPTERTRPDGLTTVVVTETTSANSASSSSYGVSATRGAWQRVVWRDVGGLLVNADLTQINWTYNGLSVSGGSTTGGWFFNTATGWQLGNHGGSGVYGSGSAYYLGNTYATFSNSQFCAPLPTVYTYYYYNRVWGQKDGTATRSQSSDSVDDCLRLHVDIEAGYGQWS